MKRTLLVQDAVLVRQVAMAVGQQALTELRRYHTERKEFYEASKVAYAGVLVVGYYAARDGTGSSSIEEAQTLGRTKSTFLFGLETSDHSRFDG